MMQQREVRELGLDLSRRELLGVAGGAAVGISALGLAPTAAEAAMKPQYGGSIKIGLRSDISRLDPHPLYPPYPTSNAMSLIYNGMTEADYDLNVIPALAHAWETSKDGLVWTWSAELVKEKLEGTRGSSIYPVSIKGIRSAQRCSEARGLFGKDLQDKPPPSLLP